MVWTLWLMMSYLVSSFFFFNSRQLLPLILTMSAVRARQYVFPGPFFSRQYFRNVISRRFRAPELWWMIWDGWKWQSVWLTPPLKHKTNPPSENPHPRTSLVYRSTVASTTPDTLAMCMCLTEPYQGCQHEQGCVQTSGRNLCEHEECPLLTIASFKGQPRILRFVQQVIKIWSLIVSKLPSPNYKVLYGNLYIEKF